MFKCMECGEVFETPVQIHEDTYEPYPMLVRFKGCPSCGGDFYAILKCETCETEIEDIPGDYIHVEGYGNVCCDCYSYRNIHDYE